MLGYRLSYIRPPTYVSKLGSGIPIYLRSTPAAVHVCVLLTNTWLRLLHVEMFHQPTSINNQRCNPLFMPNSRNHPLDSCRYTIHCCRREGKNEIPPRWWNIQ
ncbi:unnamed protein product [Ectocarpus sp. 4 AP-2014]